MPEISRFFGIRIAMFFDEHAPPYFHARYGEHTASIGIESLAVMAGYLPSRALGLIVECLEGTGSRPLEVGRPHR